MPETGRARQYPADPPAASLLRRVGVGALFGVGADVLLLVGQLGSRELASHPLSKVDAALVILGGAVAGGAFHLLKRVAARSVFHDYLTWGVATALGAAIAAISESLATRSPKALLGAVAFGFILGLGARSSVRYANARRG